MTVERIDCANDPRLAPYRDVGDGELLRERRLFVAEGRLVVRRAIEDRRYAIRSMLVNDAALRDLAPALEMLDAAASALVWPARAFFPPSATYNPRVSPLPVPPPAAPPAAPPL